MAEEKVFWLGKGTLGDIKNGEEIPKDYITQQRFHELEKQGLIGSKIVATVENASEKDLEIKDLKAQKETLNKKLSSAEKEVSKLEASLKKVSAEKDKLIKDAAKVSAEKDKLIKDAAKVSAEKDKLIKDAAKVSAEKEVDGKPEKAKTEAGKAGPK